MSFPVPPLFDFCMSSFWSEATKNLRKRHLSATLRKRSGGAPDPFANTQNNKKNYRLLLHSGLLTLDSGLIRGTSNE